MHQRIKTLLEWLKFTFFAAAGMLLMITLFNSTRIDIGAFKVLVSLTPFQSGTTVLGIPPIGEIKALTHWFFFQLNITLINVDIDLLSQNAQNLNSLESWTDQMIGDVRRGIIWFSVHSAIVSFIGGAVAVYLGCPSIKRFRFWKGGGAGAICFLLLFSFTLVIPFSFDAFDTPQYYGILSAAPWAMNFFDRGLTAVQTFTDQLKVKADNLNYLFAHLEEFSPVEVLPTLKVLHVSDIHNNPAAVEFITKVAEVYDIDMVIDTGDITDYGTSLEAELISGVANLGIPYVLVPGNHDSPSAVEHLRNEGVIVLENEVIELKGLTIGGVADPAYYNIDRITTPEHKLRKYAELYRNIFENPEKPLDILAVHDPIIAYTLRDTALLALSGHTHKPSVNVQEDTIFINAGTSGASGLRVLNSPENAHYTMFLLYFQEDHTGKLRLSAGDLISVPQLSGGFKIERFLFSAREE